MTRYKIPRQTELKLAPDDDVTPYRNYTTKADVVGELRTRLDGDWLLLVVGESVVQVREGQVEVVQ